MMTSNISRRRLFLVLLLLTCVTYVTVMRRYLRRPTQPGKVNDGVNGAQKLVNIQQEYEFLKASRFTISQQERLHRVYNTCATVRVTSPEMIENISVRLIYAEDYKLAYISIPKVGSTFLKKLFYVLKFGYENAHKIFDKMRIEVHAMTDDLVSHIPGSDLNNVTTVISVRNPYSRLYSAYLDKVYLPLSISLGKSIIHENLMEEFGTDKNTEKSLGKSISGFRPNAALLREKLSILSCTANISFQEFLDFVLRDPIKGKAMFDHYAPISLLLPKYFCKLKHLIIIKQETFDEDVEQFLKQIDAEDNVHSLFYEHLHSARAESTIVSIIDTAYRQIRMQSAAASRTDCWNMPVMAERLWKTFQLQGYIDAGDDFPRSKFSEKAYHDPGYLIKVIQHHLIRKTLSHDESEMQRKEAILEAYRNIKNTTFRRIHEVYATDFQMFGYEKDLLKSYK